MLVDPLSFGVVPYDALVETRTFAKVWRNPDGAEIPVALTLTIRGLDLADEYLAIDQGAALKRKFAPEDGPCESIKLGAKSIPVSGQLCAAVAEILIAQEGADFYDFEALVRYAYLLSDEWNEVMRWSADLTARSKARGKVTKTPCP